MTAPGREATAAVYSWCASARQLLVAEFFRSTGRQDTPCGCPEEALIRSHVEGCPWFTAFVEAGREATATIWCSHCRTIDVQEEGQMCPGCRQQWAEESSSLAGFVSAEQIIAAAMVQRPDPAEVIAMLAEIGWGPR